MPTVRVTLLFLLVPITYGTWLYHVNTLVPDPYLDEVFHIPQAQGYCDGQFQTWDPKITTPPGLYLVSYAVVRTRRLISSSSGDVCSVADLRWLNAAITLLVLPFQIWDLYRRLFPERARKSGHDSATLFHSVSNICLFPLLFFFSGLYYTDVCSVSFVLAVYQYHVRSLRDGATTRWMDAVMVFFVGIGALLMRQTNIFWVAVFLGGLHAVHQVKSQGRREADGSKASPNISEAVYDPPISEAYLEGI
jgi:alpha-1,2-glucosyltransferase